MLWGLLALVLLFWIVGFVLRVAGGMIHILLVVALLIFIYNLVTSRRSGM